MEQEQEQGSRKARRVAEDVSLVSAGVVDVDAEQPVVLSPERQHVLTCVQALLDDPMAANATGAHIREFAAFIAHVRASGVVPVTSFTPTTTELTVFGETVIAVLFAAMHLAVDKRQAIQSVSETFANTAATMFSLNPAQLPELLRQCICANFLVGIEVLELGFQHHLAHQSSRWMVDTAMIGLRDCPDGAFSWIQTMLKAGDVSLYTRAVPVLLDAVFAQAVFASKYQPILALLMHLPRPDIAAVHAFLPLALSGVDLLPDLKLTLRRNAHFIVRHVVLYAFAAKPVGAGLTAMHILNLARFVVDAVPVSEFEELFTITTATHIEHDAVLGNVGMPPGGMRPNPFAAGARLVLTKLAPTPLTSDMFDAPTALATLGMFSMLLTFAAPGDGVSAPFQVLGNARDSVYDFKAEAVLVRYFAASADFLLKLLVSTDTAPMAHRMMSVHIGRHVHNHQQFIYDIGVGGPQFRVFFGPPRIPIAARLMDQLRVENTVAPEKKKATTKALTKIPSARAFWEIAKPTGHFAESCRYNARVEWLRACITTSRHINNPGAMDIGA
jgi:hypothetical protein